MSLTHKILISSINSEGQGIGSLDGLKVFVEDALINEQVLVKIVEKRKNYAVGEMVERITSSPDRVSPPCPHFKECGGCQLMHLAYQQQLRYKEQKVLDAFTKIAKLKVTLEACVPSPYTLAYRNKIQLPFIWDKEKKLLGFFKKKTHEIIPIEHCLIQTELGNRLLNHIQTTLTLPSVRYVLIKTSKDHKEAQITFVTTGTHSQELHLYAQQLMVSYSEIKGVIENINVRNDNIILTTNERVVLGEAFITETLLGKRFRIASSSFFQVHPYQAERLFAKALELANPSPDQIIVDAYCGVGTLTILSSDKVKKAIGIELSKQAITMAKQNALLNNKSNCTFYAGSAEKLLDQFPQIHTLFINPPRKGCDPLFLTKVKNILPNTIIYISCNPATLARDISLLPEYQVISIHPFDMFPQTTHVETLVLLIKKDSK
jgi:23S rRNA (uracil1939-C5)-methyltransferase